MSKLIQNAVRIVDEDLFLVSTHVHDFVMHRLQDGREIAVDGGLAYTRRVGDLYALDEEGKYEEWSMSDDWPLADVAEKLLWGTRGKDGTEPLRWRPIKEFTREHLQAIVDGEHAQPGGVADQVVRYWLEKKTT